MRTHGKWSTYNTCHCRCELCCQVAREKARIRQARMNARRRAADPLAVHQCIFCREWFPTTRGLHVHETTIHTYLRESG